MTSMRKNIFKLMVGVFALSLTVAACNNGGSKKESTTDTTKKTEQTTMPAKDTTQKGDTSLKKQPTDPGSGGGTTN